jgi:hypothetical protein
VGSWVLRSNSETFIFGEGEGGRIWGSHLNLISDNHNFLKGSYLCSTNFIIVRSLLFENKFLKL